MKIRQVLDRLDEISRRDFLKGAGAAAVGGLASKDSKADWKDIYKKDMLTNKFKMKASRNLSEEDKSVYLVYIPNLSGDHWEIHIPFSAKSIPIKQRQMLKTLNWREDSDGNLHSRYIFRILLGKTFNNQIVSRSGSIACFMNKDPWFSFYLAFENTNQDIARMLKLSYLNKDNLKIELDVNSTANIYTFLGKHESIGIVSPEDDKPSTNQQKSNVKDI